MPRRPLNFEPTGIVDSCLEKQASDRPDTGDRHQPFAYFVLPRQLSEPPINQGFLLPHHIARFEQRLDRHSQIGTVGKQNFHLRRERTSIHVTQF